MPSWRAAASVSLSDSTAGGSSGFHRTATRERPPMISLSNWSRFPLNSGDRRLLPVMFPPGRAKLATNPLPTGSLLAVITMGMLWVACWTARTACEPPATITLTFRLMSSAASRASVSVRSATRYSMMIFFPRHILIHAIPAGSRVHDSSEPAHQCATSAQVAERAPRAAKMLPLRLVA